MRQVDVLVGLIQVPRRFKEPAGSVNLVRLESPARAAYNFYHLNP